MGWSRKLGRVERQLYGHFRCIDLQREAFIPANAINFNHTLTVKRGQTPKGQHARLGSVMLVSLLIPSEKHLLRAVFFAVTTNSHPHRSMEFKHPDTRKATSRKLGVSAGERVQRARQLWRWMYHDGMWARSIEATADMQDGFSQAFR